MESKYMCSLDLQYSNNQVEYQDVILGLKVLLSMEAKVIKILRDTQLVIKQLIVEYKCNNPVLIKILKIESDIESNKL